MASGFKQQCPSCEAMVPIRDPNLVGRKIDCPTCKYRFVVEEPAEEEPAPAAADVAGAKSRKGRPAAAARRPGGKDAPAKTRPTGRRRDADDEDEGLPRAKSGDGGSTKLVVGLVAGLLGVGLIAVAVYFGFFHETTPAPRPAPPSGPSQVGTGPSTPTPTPTTPDGTGTGGTGAVGIAGGTPDTPPATTPDGRPLLNPADVYTEITNLLPNDTEGIIHLPFSTLHNSTIGLLAFEGPGTFTSAEFENRVGIGLKEVDRTVHAINFNKNWTYHVVKTVQPINLKAVEDALKLRPAPGGTKDYYHSDSNDWLDAMFRNKAALGAAKLKTLAVYLHNPTTLIFGDDEPVRSFVGAAGRFNPIHKGPYLPLAAAPAPGAPAATTGESSTGGGSGAASFGLTLRDPGSTPAAGAPGDAQPVRAYFVTSPAALKAMLDRLEERPALASMAFDARASAGRLEKFIPTFYQMTVLAGFTPRQLQEGAVLGLSVHRARNGLSMNTILECRTVDASRTLRKTLQDHASKLAKLLEATFGVKATVVTDQPDPADAPGAQGGVPVAGETPRTGGSGAVGISGDAGIGPRSGATGIGTVTPPGGRTPGGQPEIGALENSTIEARREDRLVSLRVNLVLDESGNRKLEALVRRHVSQLRGDQEMAAGQPRWDEVGKRTVEEREAKGGAYPRGTVHREPDGPRAGIPYPPHQRVSWMASLLPHLGHDVQINFKKSWRDPENLPAAAVLVPQFLDPRSPRSAWWVRYPGMTQDVAATHLVGMAGIGPDAAEYRADDPNTKAKLGVFGYDRVTKLADIKDGAEHTIMMIQVPPTFKRPWMAGGGATVMGVPDPPPPSQRSVTPFVSTQHNGKAGTMAIMADGSVRFIAADIPDELFKAMCTTQGGDQKFLDRDAPLVKGADSSTALRTDPPQQPAKPEARSFPPVAQWKEHTSAEGGFSVLLPAEPQTVKRSVKTPAGDIEMNILMVQKSFTESVGVIFANYPAALVQKVGAEGIYEGSKMGLSQQLPGGKLTKEEKITIGGHPGREFFIDLTGKALVRLRIVLVKERLYQVMITGSSELVSSADADRYLASFKLLAK